MKKRNKISGFSWDKEKTIVLIIIIAFTVFLFFRFPHFSEKYGQQYPILLLALLVTSIAAVTNLLSLKWSRDTIRPFLFPFAGTIYIEQTKTKRIISFRIHNSGSLPATNIEVDVDIFASDEEITEENISNRFIPATKLSIKTMLLPNSNCIEKYGLNLEDKDDLEQWEAINQGKSKIRFRISYESKNRKHATIQTAEIRKNEGDDTLALVPIPPQNWK